MALSSTGITTSKVAQAIGVGSNDVGTLCKHPNVNKWSKWKPISYDKVSGLSLTELRSENYGLVANNSASVDVLRSLIGLDDGSGSDGVRWLYPTGGAQSPFRLGDFRNYNHNAAIPFGSGINTTTAQVVKKGSASIYNYDYFHNPLYKGGGVHLSLGDEYSVGFNDLYPSISTLYTGIYLRLKSTGANIWFTTSETNANGIVCPRVNWNLAPIKTWLGEVECFYFFANISRAQGASYTQQKTDRFYAWCNDSNNINPFNLNVTDDLADNSMVYWLDVSLTHDTSIDKYAGRVYLSSVGAAYSGGSIGDLQVVIYDYNGFSTQIGSMSYDDMSLGSEEAKGVTFLITSAEGNEALYYRVYLNSTVIKESIMPVGSLQE